MLSALLAAATLAGSVAIPLLPPPQTAAAVLANVTAFNRPCVGFASSTPKRLAATASSALRALGWEVGSAIGQSFGASTSLQMIAPAGAIYVHSHGDHYLDPQTGVRSSGFRVDGGFCTNAPKVIASQIVAQRGTAAPMTLAVVSTCHNGERASKLPAAFGIAMRKTAPGATGPRSFYLGYVGIAWVRAAARFERVFWREIGDGSSVGAAFEQALLAGFDPSDLVPEWWGSYDLYPSAPGARGMALHG
jgi:hypothetical protein